MNLKELIKNTEVLAYGGNLDTEVLDLVYDTREIKPHSLFVAISGFKIDGHKFIQEAFQKKAVAAIIENSKFRSEEYSWIQVPDSRKALADLSCAFYGQPSHYLNMIGVTGTNGKTTTTNLITAILEDAGHLTGLVGTIHNRIGKKTLPVRHTTPEAPDLQRLLRFFLANNAAYGVLEVSSHALELQRVRNTEFDIVVFTNLTQEHLDFHQNMENYLLAKGKLFSNIGYQVHKQRRKFAIFNVDDPYSQYLAELTRVPIITYGLKNNADVQAEEVQVTSGGVQFILKYTDQRIPVKLKLTGLFNVYNALAAIAVGLVEGISIERIIATLENIAGIPGRFEKVNGGHEYTVIVDYSHTSDSLENCLKTALEFAQGRIITVFGCGGDRDRTKRPLMGEVAGRYSDLCIVTSDNPRSEDPEAIIAEIIPGVEKGSQGKPFWSIVDRGEAILKAIQEAKPEDVVIIAGKGHEDYQLIGSQVLPFDDRKVAQKALRQTGKWRD
ncbi:MAG TPA: UDP-N-acetylmuramoyl-L-alanyl-D-glutamate--2,6-diaminopimelate ligase [Clostridia bacterium]|nr:UDP-N-acetylmuramoyl-L-alanyl-D-glutamate--2,6-diaminopimelate ligase [Clostridia bacterium]HHY05525.1 UDP-N-acetylmuramoyl-L-alanyl-D-glutamate--2,6-diaminopimelate ligase [Clostridia bacterium]